MAFREKLARIRGFFRRSKRDTPTTIVLEVADTEIDGGIEEQGEQSQLAPPQRVRYLDPTAAIIRCTN